MYIGKRYDTEKEDSSSVDMDERAIEMGGR
jgi:hypothetical protein